MSDTDEQLTDERELIEGSDDRGFTEICNDDSEASEVPEDIEIECGEIDVDRDLGSDDKECTEVPDDTTFTEVYRDDSEFSSVLGDHDNIEFTEIADDSDLSEIPDNIELSAVHSEDRELSDGFDDKEVTDNSDIQTDHNENNGDGVRHRRPGALLVNGQPVRPRKSKASQRQKAKKILEVLNHEPVDMAELRQQAISHGGLLNDNLRKRAWPLLLNVNVNNITPKPDQEVLKGHRDYQQVVLDVARSLRRFPPGMEEQHRLSLQDNLVDVIMRVLVKHPELDYYQGFHDICVTFLLVVNEDLAFALCEKLALNHLRDYMEPTMERTTQQLNYLPPLLKKANPDLYNYLEGAELGNIFCISWLLTWFGHVLSDIESILRIYDFFIACHPLMPIYVTGAVVLHREEEIFATEQEMPFLHALLSKVPDILPFEQLLSHAGDLYLQYPPTELANEALRRFRKAQEQAAARRSQIATKQVTAGKHALTDGNVTFTKVTCWMLGAVVSVAAYALYTSMEWDLSQWMPHG